jgi:hypothetical protein
MIRIMSGAEVPTEQRLLRVGRQTSDTTTHAWEEVFVSPRYRPLVCESLDALPVTSEMGRLCPSASSRRRPVFAALSGNR